MEIKVRELTDVEEKSVQQVEQELLEKHEAQQELKFEEDLKVEVEKKDTDTTSKSESTESQTEEPKKEEVSDEVKEEVVEETKPLTEEEVLSFIGDRYGKQINSIDELVTAREESPEMPSDVAAYFKYKKETGRSIEDFVKLQRDYSDFHPDALLKEYLTITEEGLDPEDIDSLMEDYVYDEDVDDESVIKKTKLAKKKIIAKAKKFFKDQQEQYKLPLESRENSFTDSEEYKTYQQYVKSAQSQQEEAQRKSEWFIKKSDELFNNEFKGFKFNLDESEIYFTPGATSEIKKAQETPMNFVNKFLDSNGLLKDAEGYHRSLAIAMNPEKFAQFFYEQGKSSATEDVLRKTKNINMSTRKTPELAVKSGFQVKSVSSPSSNGLRIKSIKKT
tara:strand:+ start:25659 stop:26828 length:1170 start_codon:yes stop_codon:yes gene_type:complete